MKRKLNITFDFLLMIYVIINLLYMAVGTYLVFNRLLKFEVFSYGYIVLLTINIIIILILFFKKKYIKNKIDIFLLLIIIFAGISTIFAYDQSKALFGEWNRYEGLFVISYYITITFITSHLKKEYRKKVVYSILILGFTEYLYAICQKLNLFNVHARVVNSARWATGFTANRNFFGTIMILCICYSIGLYLTSKDKHGKILFIIITYMFSIGLFLSKTLSCIVALVLIMLILLIYSIKTKKLKKYFVLVFILSFSLIFIESVNLSSYRRDVSTAKREINEIAKGNMDNKYGSGRIEIWKKTIKVVPKYLLHGVGVDNFSNIINGGPIYRDRFIVDKAHNEYLQILVTMGIFSLISYLCMHFLAIRDGIKSKEIYLLLPVIGYLVQAQFNISVIEVAPIFYISLGLLVDRKSGDVNCIKNT